MEECVPLFRELYARDPERYSTRLPEPFSFYGNVLDDLQRYTEALVLGDESIALTRPLYLLSPDRFRLNLATRLYDKSRILFHLSRPTEQLEVVVETAGLTKTLFQQNPVQHRAFHSIVLDLYRSLLSKSGQEEEALKVGEELSAL